MSLNRRLPGLPNAPKDGTTEQSQWMDQVTTALRSGLGQSKHQDDKWLTWQDLERTEVVVRSTGPGGGYLPSNPAPDPPDMTPPPGLENVEASGGMTAIYIKWSDPALAYYYHIEVHRSQSNDVTSAVLAGTTMGNIFQDVVGSDDTTKYYWVRIVRQSGGHNIIGPWHGTEGVEAAAATDPDWILKDLEGRINDSHLNDLLSGEIEKIPRIEIDLGDLEEGLNTEVKARKDEDTSIHSRIDTNVSRIGDNTAAIVKESETRATEDEALAKQIETLAVEVGDNKAAIQTESEVRATEDEALASQITQLQAETEGQFAGIRDELTVIVGDQEQLASRVGTVELDLEDTKGAIEQQFRVVNDELEGIRAEYTVKLDVDGYVGGFGLVNDGDVITALWRVDVFGVGAPGSESLVFAIDAEESRVVMDGAFIKTATINDAQIGSMTVDKLTGGTADWVEANIRDGSITNAKIGNVIQSNNYVSGTSGWVLSKDGFFESQNAYIRGRIHGSEITGSVIQGSVIIGSDDMLIPTEADKGPGTTRFLTYIEPFSATGYESVSVPMSGNRPLNEKGSSTISCFLKNIVSANYIGDGETNGVWNNYRRYKNFNVSPVIYFETGSMTGYDSWDYAWDVSGVNRIKYTITINNNHTGVFEFTFKERGAFNKKNGGIIFNGNIISENGYGSYDGYISVIKGNISTDSKLIDFRGDKNLSIKIDSEFTRSSHWVSQSGYGRPADLRSPAFSNKITIEDHSYNRSEQMLAKTNSAVLAELEKQFLSTTDLFKDREKWRSDLESSNES